MSEQTYEKISEFLYEINQFLLFKFSIYLNRRVFIMRLCCPYLSLIPPAFGAPGGLYFVIVAFPVSLHIFLCI